MSDILQIMEITYKVQKIVKKKNDKITGKQMYKIKWLGYPYNESTWEPIENLQDCLGLVDQFEKRQLNSNQHPPHSQMVEETGQINKSQPARIDVQKLKSKPQSQQKKSEKRSKVQFIKLNAQLRPNRSQNKKININTSQQQCNENPSKKGQIQDTGIKARQSPAIVIDDEEQDQIRVVQVSQDRHGQMFFKIKVEVAEQSRWVSHRKMKVSFPIQLIQYYQTIMTLVESQQEQLD